MSERNINLRNKVMEALGDLWFDKSVSPDKTVSALRHIADSASRMADRTERFRGVNAPESPTPIGAAADTCPFCHRMKHDVKSITHHMHNIRCQF